MPPSPTDPRPLVTIGETVYTGDDFTTWWRLWKEKEMAFPETPAPYIDWLLQVREAEMMELYRRPTYRAKIETYLQARSLLILRQDEVEDQIKKDEQTVYHHYLTYFTPRWRIIPRFFKSQEEARAWKDSKAANTDERQKDPHAPVMGRWYRPSSLPKGWQPVVDTLNTAQLSAPFAADDKVVVLELTDRQGPEKEDFAAVRTAVEQSSYKSQKQELTARLLDRLMAKYKVVIDQQLLERIDFKADNSAIGEKNLVTSSRSQLTVADFVALAGKNRPMILNDATDSTRKEQMVRNILAHNLVSWEALDRHYEERPPFSENFRFYKGHRLVRELEAAVLKPQAEVEKASIDKYYQDNLAQYEGAVQITYATIEADAATVREIWVNVLQGANFLTSCKEITGKDATSRTETTAHLPAEIATTIAGLAPGELSKPIIGEPGRATLVWLADRKQLPTTPLEKVQESIRQTLSDAAMDEARSALLADLKKRISIHVDQTTWKDISQEYTGK